jgi:lysophospholipase L1-like esterase
MDPLSSRLSRVIAGSVTALAVTGILAATASAAAARTSEPAATAATSPVWVGTWAAAQVAPGTTGLSHTGFKNETVRDIIRTSAGGTRVQIRLSNEFGTAPLTVSDVKIAVATTGAATGAQHQVTFGGEKKFTIKPGKDALSDPVTMSVRAESNLAVSIYFKAATGPATWHPGSLTTSYYSTAGDHAGATAAKTFTHSIGAWYFLSGVNVVNPNVAGAVVAFGASTTDGIGSTANADERYTDDLAELLLTRPAGQRMSVLNEGIPGNEVLFNQAGSGGQSGLNRFLRDAIEQAGVKVIIVWEGMNDIGDNPGLSYTQLTDAYTQMASEAHAYGIRLVVATLQPYEGAAYYTAAGNQVREQVNHWITRQGRNGGFGGSGTIDGYFDFATVLGGYPDAQQLLPQYDSGDHLHPNDAGYQAIVTDAIAPNLDLLTGTSTAG